jgi:hypothetical protein
LLKPQGRSELRPCGKACATQSAKCSTGVPNAEVKYDRMNRRAILCIVLSTGVAALVTFRPWYNPHLLSSVHTDGTSNSWHLLCTISMSSRSFVRPGVLQSSSNCMAPLVKSRRWSWNSSLSFWCVSKRLRLFRRGKVALTRLGECRDFLRVAFQNAHGALFLLPKRFAMCLLPLGSPDLSGDAVLSMIRCSYPESLHDPGIPCHIHFIPENHDLAWT